ncbi:MAG: hypothetical protein FJ225_07335 [Lentisphaerae bacterium]|nr:hypothetical protein [Lentisphaerota bacterium]
MERSCNLNLNIMSDWWQRQLGLPLTASRADMAAAFEKAFPGLLTFRPEAAPEPVPDPNHGYTMLLAMGATVIRNAGSGYDVEPMPVERFAGLEPPDYGNNPFVQKLREAIRETRRKHGSAFDGSYSGVLYPAMKLRGQEIFSDFYEHPDEVRRFAAAMGETIRRHVLFLKRECGSLPYFVLGNCSNCMISPVIYEQFFLREESAISRLSEPVMGRRRAMGVHHCGTKVDAYIDAYAQIEELEMLEANWDSDVALATRRIPGLLFKSMLDPLKLDAMDEDAIEAHLREQFACPATVEIQAFGISGAFTVGKMRRLLETALDCIRAPGMSGYTRLIG